MGELLLVQLPYYLCSLAAFATAGLGVGAVWKRLRPPWLLLGSLAFVALGTAFYLLAITGAPGGHMLRSTVLHPIRWLNLLAGVTWLLWLALFVRSMVSVTRKD